MEVRGQKEIQTYYVMSLSGAQKKQDIRWRRYCSVQGLLCLFQNRGMCPER